MERPIFGIHHVTAIASNPQGHLDFYTEVLALRLVKRKPVWSGSLRSTNSLHSTHAL
jgi:catechol 2,3-dioxygenase-like lactoylglutathione lyase family enzyme